MGADCGFGRDARATDDDALEGFSRVYREMVVVQSSRRCHFAMAWDGFTDSMWYVEESLRMKVRKDVMLAQTRRETQRVHSEL